MSSSSFSVMDSYMDLDAPSRSLTLVSLRLADKAAPAAFCCALDSAGIVILLKYIHEPPNGCYLGGSESAAHLVPYRQRAWWTQGGPTRRGITTSDLPASV